MDTRFRWLLALPLLLSLAGCGAADLIDVDPDAVPAQPTYSELVGPMMHFYCAGCHAPRTQLGPNLANYDYSSYSGVVAGFQGIKDSVFERGDMPPGGAQKLTRVEQETLRKWAELGFPQ